MPDGSEVTVEGTPAEIAEFERQQKKGEVSENPKKSGKKILLEDDVRDVFEKLNELFDRFPRIVTVPMPYPVYHHFCTGCSQCQPYQHLPPGPVWISQPSVICTATDSCFSSEPSGMTGVLRKVDLS